jgi:hypothetical protein
MSGRCYPPGQATCVRYPVSAPLELCPLTKLVRPRGFYRPDGLLEGLAPHLADPTAGIVDLHMYTFNAVEASSRGGGRISRSWEPRSRLREIRHPSGISNHS